MGSVTGKTVENLATTIEDYQNAKLIWNKSGEISVHTSGPHTLLDNDTVVISGISTFIAKLNGEHVIGVLQKKQNYCRYSSNYCSRYSN